MKQLSIPEIITAMGQSGKVVNEYALNIDSKVVIGVVPPSNFTDGMIFTHAGKEYLFAILKRERFDHMLLITWQVELLILPSKVEGNDE